MPTKASYYIPGDVIGQIISDVYTHSLDFPSDVLNGVFVQEFWKSVDHEPEVEISYYYDGEFGEHVEQN